MATLSLDDRVRGCLIGCSVGVQVGFSRFANPERFAVAEPSEALSLRLDRPGAFKQEPKRINSLPLTPFVDLGVRAYVAAGGRATPEVLGELLKNDRRIAKGAYGWEEIHSTQEVLKEGMHPRLSGLHATPSGLIAAAMPAVGIYHFADPERAYLDGVELASVAQGQRGADWAALCAAAIAAALDKGAAADSVVKITLAIAHENNKEVFYELNRPAQQAWLAKADEQAFLKWWLQSGGLIDATQHHTNWVAYNPLRFILPLLEAYGDKPQALLGLILAPAAGDCLETWLLGGHLVSAVVAGAIVGALHGPQVFPQAWLKWAQPTAKPWLKILDVVKDRLAQERSIIGKVTTLAAKPSRKSPGLEDRIAGCLLAGAIGNAMGSPVEGRNYTEIDQQYPGGIQGVLEPWRLESEDDNQMAMHMVETYLARDGRPVMARHFGRTWRQKLNRNHFWPRCMGHAYDLIRQGADARITGHWITVTGSTVMCLEPAGLYNLCDPQSAQFDATAISYMYQRGLDVTAAANMAATTAGALEPDATVDSVCQAALDLAPRGRMLTFDRRPFKSPHEYLARCLDVADKYDDVLAARKELYAKCLLYHCIDPLELWGLALAMFKIARGDVRLSAVGGTNIGRDSDTIAGRAAMLAGALRGAKAVPAEWVKLFGKPSLQRIRSNARQLSQLIAGPKLAVLRRRADIAASM